MAKAKTKANAGLETLSPIAALMRVWESANINYNYTDLDKFYEVIIVNVIYLHQISNDRILNFE